MMSPVLRRIPPEWPGGTSKKDHARLGARDSPCNESVATQLVHAVVIGTCQVPETRFIKDLPIGGNSPKGEKQISTLNRLDLCTFIDARLIVALIVPIMLKRWCCSLL
jgi:hypothetical protein